jgi:EAL domain-containing protein (putative c-di-GMP-specific phosphodiesterase class I)/GGDEF domain-containing protein
VPSSGYVKIVRQLTGWDSDMPAAMFYVDIRGLRHINQIASPAAAEVLITKVARTMKRWAGTKGIAGRLWSGEFLAVKSIDHAQGALEEAIKLRSTLSGLSYKGAEGETPLSVSIGVVVARPGCDWPGLIAQATDACDTAKERGLNQISFYTPGKVGTRRPPSNASAVTEFRRLLNAGALSLHPQPIMAIGGREPRIAKAEFLLRIERNGTHTPPPPGMIEALERNGFSSELDHFSSRYVLSWLLDNPGVLDRLTSVSLNLSARSFVDGLFMSRLYDDVRNAHLPRGKLSFEITETAAIQHLGVAAEIIEEFQTLGCRFSLDDFGAGLCSFGYLHSLPVNEVKIDGRFIREVAQNPVTQKIVRAIHQVAHATGKTTVAEFVDDPRKLAVLQEMGFDYAQGWLFYPTVPPEKFLELIGMKKPRSEQTIF